MAQMRTIRCLVATQEGKYQFYRILTVVYYSWHYWISELCLSFGIQKRTHRFGNCICFCEEVASTYSVASFRRESQDNHSQ